MEGRPESAWGRVASLSHGPDLRVAEESDWKSALFSQEKLGCSNTLTPEFYLVNTIKFVWGS